MATDAAEFVILLGEEESPADLQPNDESGRVTFSLNAEATIETVNDLYIKLQEIGDIEKLVKVDAGNVKQIDTAALQVLLGFCRYRESRNLKTEFANESMAFTDVVDLLGFRSALNV